MIGFLSLSCGFPFTLFFILVSLTLSFADVLFWCAAKNDVCQFPSKCISWMNTKHNWSGHRNYWTVELENHTPASLMLCEKRLQANIILNNNPNHRPVSRKRSQFITATRSKQTEQARTKVHRKTVLPKRLPFNLKSVLMCFKCVCVYVLN